jgi:tetratricopeptide (TPR) repeat protein
LAFALGKLAAVLRNLGDYARARALFEEGLREARPTEDRKLIAYLVTGLAMVARCEGSYDQAIRLYREARGLHEQSGARAGIAGTLLCLGEVALLQGDWATARRDYAKGLALYEELRDPRMIAYARRGLGHALSRQGDTRSAHGFLVEALRAFRDLREYKAVPGCLEGLAALATATDRPERAAQLFGAAAALRNAMSIALPPAERAHLERQLEAVRARVAEEVFAPAWECGHAMSTVQAIEEALALEASSEPPYPPARPSVSWRAASNRPGAAAFDAQRPLPAARAGPSRREEGRASARG